MNKEFLEITFRSDKGMVRESNEDAVAVLPEKGFVMVADGMGGCKAGEVASQLAVDIISNQVHALIPTDGHNGSRARDTEVIRDAVENANDTIFHTATQVPEYGGMGTTVVLGLFTPSRLLVAHVGDSRLYRVQGNTFKQLTTDHSVVQELVAEGMFESVEEAQEAGLGANVLTRALGIDESVTTDISELELQAGDLYLFCSDGLSNMIGTEELKNRLHQDAEDLEEVADSLMAKACEYGGTDNISLVLVRVRGVAGH